MTSKAEAARVARLGERLGQMKQDREAAIDAVISEFNGDIGAMAAALLRHRHTLRQLANAGEMIRQGKSFVVL